MAFFRFSASFSQSIIYSILSAFYKRDYFDYSISPQKSKQRFHLLAGSRIQLCKFNKRAYQVKSKTGNNL